jgi:hypothetical protein
MEEYKDIFSSPTGVPTHCQVKHPIDLTLDTHLPNVPVYHRLLMENDEIRRHIQEILQKGHIKPNSSPYGTLIVLVQKKDGTWRICIDYRALKKSQSRTNTPFSGLMTFLTNSRGEISSASLT